MAKKHFWKGIGAFLARYKEGWISGAVVGAGAAYYLKMKGISFMAALTQKGLIDSVMGRSAPVDIAFTKVLVTFVLLGALIGLLIDYLFHPGTKRK
jgi:hypothetical protein